MSHTAIQNGLYKALSKEKQEIRLLTIPCAVEDAPLECSLSTVSLLDNPQYDALSYVWGDPSITLGALIRAPGDVEVETQITTNLHSALSHIREATGGQPLVIWADALCVDQYSIRERSQQVTMMYQIFASARCVRMWLGAGQREVEFSCLMLANLPQAVALVAHGTESDAGRHDNMDRMGSGANAVLSGSKSNAVPTRRMNKELFWYGLFVLLEMPYWTRAWIQQELVANDNNVIHYGYYEGTLLPWAALLRILSKFPRADPDLAVELPSLAAVSLNVLSNLTSSELCRGRTREDEDTRKIVMHNTIVESAASVQASNALDLVFARRGIFPPFASCEPDYSKSVSEVYAEATFHILDVRQDCNLNPWQAPLTSEFPSWTIDFRLSALQRGLRWIYLHEETAQFDASACSSGRVTHVDKALLAVAGFQIDEISEIRPLGPSNHHTSDEEILVNRGRAWLLVASEWISRTTTNDAQYSIVQAVGRTFIAGLGRVDGRIQRCDDEHVASVLDYYRNFDTETTITGDPDETVKLQLRDTIGMGSFIVTKGDRIGVAPPLAEVGDRIAIFASGNMPFVLRPAEPRADGSPTYRLIGMCYIDGIMDGEIVKARAAERFGDEKAVNEVFDEMITLV